MTPKETLLLSAIKNIAWALRGRYEFDGMVEYLDFLVQVTEAK